MSRWAAKRGLWLAGVLAFLAGGTWLIATGRTREDAQAVGADEAGGNVGPGQVAEPGHRPERRSVIGQILLETLVGASEVVPPEAVPPRLGVADLASESSAAAETTDGLFLGLQGEGITLEPATSAGCAIRLWSAGRKVGSADGCVEDGSYDIQIVGAVEAPLWLEIEVPQRLRAAVQLPLEAPHAWPLVAPTIALGYGFEFGGVVRDEAGTPVMDASLEGRPIDTVAANDDGEAGHPDSSPPWRTYSRADGSFVWDTLPAGPLRVLVRRAGFADTVFDLDVPARDVVLSLPARFTMRGHVALVAGAFARDLQRVKVRVEGSSLSPAVELSPDHLGFFSLPDLTPGVFAVEATLLPEMGGGAQEYASVPLENVAPQQELHMVLLPAQRAEIEVAHHDGGVVAGAQVRVFRDKVGVLGRECQTDSQGKCSIHGLVDGMYWLSVQAAGALPLDGEWFEVAGASAAIKVKVSPPGSIAGRVNDRQGRPIVGVSLALRAIVAGGVARASADDAVAQGGVAHDAGRTLATVAAPFDGDSPSLHVAVTQGEVPNVSVAGDSRGPSEALAWGQLASGQGATPVLVEVASDSAGLFRFDDLLPGTYEVWALHGDFARPLPTEVNVVAGEPSHVTDIVLVSGQPVRGRVVNDNGQPIVGAAVVVDGSETYYSDAAGAFELGRRTGTLHLRGSAAGYRGEVMTLLVRETEGVVDWVFAPANGRLALRVTDHLGRPLPDATVSAREPLDRVAPELLLTDDRGLVEFDALAPGEVSLSIRHSEYGEVTQTAFLAAQPTFIEVTLALGFSLTVEVTDSRTREELGGARVRLGELSEPCDAAGKVQFVNLRGDSRLLAIEHPDYVPQRFRIEPEDLRPGKVGLIQIALARAGRIVGEVVDTRGESVSGASVRVTLGDGGESVATTGRDGKYRLGGLPDGTVEVEVVAPPRRGDLGSLRGSVVVRSDETREVDRVVLPDR